MLNYLVFLNILNWGSESEDCDSLETFIRKISATESNRTLSISICLQLHLVIKQMV